MGKIGRSNSGISGPVSLIVQGHSRAPGTELCPEDP